MTLGTVVDEMALYSIPGLDREPTNEDLDMLMARLVADHPSTAKPDRSVVPPLPLPAPRVSVLHNPSVVVGSSR